MRVFIPAMGKPSDQDLERPSEMSTSTCFRSWGTSGARPDHTVLYSGAPTEVHNE